MVVFGGDSEESTENAGAAGTVDSLAMTEVYDGGANGFPRSDDPLLFIVLLVGTVSRESVDSRDSGGVSCGSNSGEYGGGDATGDDSLSLPIFLLSTGTPCINGDEVVNRLVPCSFCSPLL